MRQILQRIPWLWIALACVLIYPMVPNLDTKVRETIGMSIGAEMATIFIMGILALALNVVVGYTGLLHLGIAAFFGMGAYVTGILTIPANPFGFSFLAALLCSMLFACLVGVALSAPLLRLRGDYLALVTLGFGLVVMYTLKNLEQITAGTKGLNPIPAPKLPGFLVPLIEGVGIKNDWAEDYRLFYYLCLGYLVLTYVFLRNLEHSRIGRAWVALREDELAAECMGLNTARLKLAALAVSAALAGLAGSLYATRLTSTADPNAYDFNRSVTIICCLILGGLGNRNGVLLGVALVVGYDNILAPLLDDVQAKLRQREGIEKYLLYPATLLMSTKGKLMLFGLVLILMMRFRPEGLLPSSRVKEEMHEADETPAPVTEAKG